MDHLRGLPVAFVGEVQVVGEGIADKLVRGQVQERHPKVGAAFGKQACVGAPVFFAGAMEDSEDRGVEVVVRPLLRGDRACAGGRERLEAEENPGLVIYRPRKERKVMKPSAGGRFDARKGIGVRLGILPARAATGLDFGERLTRGEPGEFEQRDLRQLCERAFIGNRAERTVRRTGA